MQELMTMKKKKQARKKEQEGATKKSNLFSSPRLMMFVYSLLPWQNRLHSDPLFGKYSILTDLVDEATWFTWKIAAFLNIF